MQHIRTENWYNTPSGDTRGYIHPHTLRELWFHTGTACNLQCSFCLEGSAPGDKRLQLITLEDVKPFIDEAVSLGVEQFSFTGGEPFLAKQLVAILEYASRFKPCLVLTNGTDALQKRIEQLRPLLQAAYPVSFRVSLDRADAAGHDLGRGEGNFQKALDGLKLLHTMGFSLSVARHISEGEDGEEVGQLYRSLFVQNGLPKDIRIVAFPDFLPPGSLPQVPQITTHCMAEYHSEESRKAFMCAFSKMVLKKEGQMRVYACTLVDDDEEYDLGGSLAESMRHKISMKHHRCYSCFAFGASCSES